MPRSKLEVGSFFMLFMGFFILIMSVLWIFLTEIMFVSDFKWYTGQNYADYLDISREFAEIYIITKKLIGFILLANGVLVIFITQKGYRKAEKWSWYALLISGTMTWGTFIVYKIFIGYLGGSMITFVVGATLLALGLAFPAKEILSEK
jgi:hypothetical protein